MWSKGGENICPNATHVWPQGPPSEPPIKNKNTSEMDKFPLSTFEKCSKSCCSGPEFLPGTRLLHHVTPSSSKEAMPNMKPPSESHKDQKNKQTKIDPYPLALLQNGIDYVGAALQFYPDPICNIIQSHPYLERACCTSVSPGPPIRAQKWPTTLPK